MDINETYQFIQFLVNSKQSGKITPDNFNLACKVVNIEYFNKEAGLEEEYQVGVPHARVEPQITAQITDNNRFLVTPVEIAKVGDYFPYPADYGAFLSYRYGLIENPKGCKNATLIKKWTEVVTESELALRLDNAITPPTINRPVCAYYAHGLQIHPETIQSIHLTYLKLPVAPFRAYTITNSQDIYNPTGSIQWTWPDTVIPKLCYRICVMVGVNIREGEFYEMMNQKVNSG